MMKLVAVFKLNVTEKADPRFRRCLKVPLLGVDDLWNMVGGQPVDLGLPSGTLWCDRNVGASSPEASGLYFTSGNVDGYSYDARTPFTSDAYSSTTGAALTTDIPSNALYDGAVANIGIAWRLPTATECQELLDNTNSTFVTFNGMNSLKFTNKTDSSKYIIMPLINRIFVNDMDGWGEQAHYRTSTISSGVTTLYLNRLAGNFLNENGAAYIGVVIRPVLNL